MNTIGKRIKFLRSTLNLTQEELAKKINSSRSAIAKWETDITSIPQEELRLLSIFFKVSADYLLCLTDNTIPEYQVSSNLIDFIKAPKLKKFEPITEAEEKILVSVLEGLRKNN